MNAKNILILCLTLAFTVVLLNTSCKNRKAADAATITQLSKDENDVEGASDDAANDVNEVLTRGTAKSIAGFLCNATIDSSAITNDTIKYFITYTGEICHNKKREGSVEIKKKNETSWYDEGATVIIKFNNLKITKIASNRSIKLNGFVTYKNVSGGVVREINANGTIVHSVDGVLSAEFDDGTTRVWNIAKKRTYSGTQNNIIVTVEGTGMTDGYSNLITWGVNRHGELFYTQVTVPIIHKQTCDWDPVFGMKSIAIPEKDKSATITFGFDSNGDIVNSSNCPTHCKVDWQKGNKTGTMLHTI